MPLVLVFYRVSQEISRGTLPRRCRDAPEVTCAPMAERDHRGECASFQRSGGDFPSRLHCIFLRADEFYPKIKRNHRCKNSVRITCRAFSCVSVHQLTENSATFLDASYGFLSSSTCPSKQTLLAAQVSPLVTARKIE